MAPDVPRRPSGFGHFPARRLAAPRTRKTLLQTARCTGAGPTLNPQLHVRSVRDRGVKFLFRPIAGNLPMGGDLGPRRRCAGGGARTPISGIRAEVARSRKV